MTNLIENETCAQYNLRLMLMALDALSKRVKAEGPVRLHGMVGQRAYCTTGNGMADSIPSREQLASAGLRLEVLYAGNEHFFAEVVVYDPAHAEKAV